MIVKKGSYINVYIMFISRCLILENLNYTTKDELDRTVIFDIVDGAG